MERHGNGGRRLPSNELARNGAVIRGAGSPRWTGRPGWTIRPGMRADAESLNEQITASVSLLRRHL
jgi:hypothetical protein